MKVLQRKIILHRALVTALCLALAVGALAQRTTRKNKGPRALALVEWPASGGTPRVIPVAILVDGRYYDASIYKADPVPMALEPGNVYEVEQSGESIGMATLTVARQARNGAWLADARFQTNEQLAAARRPRDTAPQTSAPEGPPKLRRGPPSPAESAPPPPSKQEPPRTSGPDEPPVLRKPTGQTPEAKQPSEPASSAPGATPPASTPASPQHEDSDHPVLRRGRPTAEQAENLPGAVQTKAAPKPPAAATGASSPAAKAAGPGRVRIAISDAAGPEPRSFTLPWKLEDQEKLRNSIIQMAGAALEGYARAHGGTHPGTLQDVQVRAFDLAGRNEPQIVLMARALEAPAAPAASRRASGARSGTKSAAPAPAPSTSVGLTFWITLAAREDYNGELRKLKVWATDSKHLDAFPRAELIDAVDADGDGRGELLFREISDIGQSFVLYRTTPDTLTQLYNSAEMEH